MKILTVDLDSTLADTTHRQFMLTAENHDDNDWHAYGKACVDDVPMTGTVEIMKAFRASGHGIFIVSGRRGSSRKETVEWLNRHGIEYDGLLLAELDWTDHLSYKVGRLQELQELDYEIVLHLDDYAPLRFALATMGIPMAAITPYWVDSFVLK